MKIIAMAAGAAALLLTGGAGFAADDERPLDHLDMAIKNIKRAYKIDATGPFDVKKTFTVVKTTCDQFRKTVQETAWDCTMDFNISDQFSSNMPRTEAFRLIHNHEPDMWIAE